MNKYFTKEYIDEANCEEIQGLRPVLKKFDIYISDGLILAMNAESWKRKSTDKIIWLPTGDQLDEEIIKTIKKHRHYVYVSQYWFKQKVHQVVIDGSILREYSDKNPLIAKIKLLKELLNDN